MYWWSSRKTTLGAITVIVSARGLTAVSLGDVPEIFVARMESRLGTTIKENLQRTEKAITQLCEYVEGERREIDTPLDLHLLSAFQRDILLRLRSIPTGSVKTYGELAREAGRPGSARAVGRALATNPLPLALPCHRVIASDGGLGGFSSPRGVEDKAALLALEGVRIP